MNRSNNMMKVKVKPIIKMMVMINKNHLNKMEVTKKKMHNRRKVKRRREREKRRRHLEKLILFDLSTIKFIKS